MRRNKIIAGLVVVVLVGIALILTPILVLDSEGDADTLEDETSTVTIVDDVGRTVEIPQPLERIVAVSGSYGPEALLALGAGDRLIGVADYAKQREELAELLEDIPGLGGSSSPNTEQLLELNPQVVIAYATYYPYSETFMTALEKAGIALLLIDFHKPEIYDRNIMAMGMLLGEEERAQELIDFENGYIDLIEETVGDLEAEKMSRVYCELYDDYKTVSAMSEVANSLIVTAGGVNVFADEPVKSPIISSEAVLERNPQVIIKQLSKNNCAQSGYGVTDPSEIISYRDAIMSRPGWDTIDAVRDGRVYLVSTDCKSTHPSIYLAYLAKAFYPDRFQDLDPEAMLEDWFQRFLGIDLVGIYGYPYS